MPILSDFSVSLKIILYILRNKAKDVKIIEYHLQNKIIIMKSPPFKSLKSDRHIVYIFLGNVNTFFRFFFLFYVI